MGNTVQEPAPERMRRPSHRMPRPERERQMLEVAGRSFAERGFHGASMEQIAARAGISKPMLYQYFGSKAGLYVAFVRQQGAVLLGAMRNATEPGAPPADALRAGTLAFLGYVDEHRPGWELLYREAANQGGPLAAEVAALHARIAAMVHRLFMAIADDQSGERTEALAYAFVGAGESIANWWLDHPTERREQVAELLVRLARGALPELDEARASGRQGEESSRP